VEEVYCRFGVRGDIIGEEESGREFWTAGGLIEGSSKLI
jgi:hypothetical protein